VKVVSQEAKVTLIVRRRECSRKMDLDHELDRELTMQSMKCIVSLDRLSLILRILLYSLSIKILFIIDFFLTILIIFLIQKN
jgi:hypothetical protein